MRRLWQMLCAPQVSVCVPVYRAEQFLYETLASIAEQDFSKYELLISVDQSTDNSYRIARQFAANNPQVSIKLFGQSKRLGWVDNLNYLIAASRAPYFCFVGHDDLIAPEYLSELYDCLQQHPHAVQAYCDIETFGDIEPQHLLQPSIKGSLTERVVDFLRNHYKAVSFRGLVRRKSIGRSYRLPHNQFNDFSIDSLAMLTLLCFGDLVRVAKPLYKKRYHEGSTHTAWNSWDEEQSIDAWLDHCGACVDILKEMEWNETQKQVILLAAQDRVLQENLHLWRPELFRELSDAKRHYLWTMMRTSFLGADEVVNAHG